MPIPVGTYRFGPENSTLAINTSRTGATAKAGHDLLIHVTAWQGSLALAADPADARVELDADATSMQVREGTGGMQAALPYVDLFAPAHNLESLAALEPYLARI